MQRQDGFSLLEVMVTVAIVAMLTVAISFAAFQRPGGVSSAAAQFDASVAAARAIAMTSGNGSTLVVMKSGNGSSLRIYSGRPTSSSAMTYSGVPDSFANASIAETHLTAPMTIFFDGSAHASAMSGAVSPGTTIAADPGCPRSGASLVFTITDSRASLTRTLRCTG